MTIHKSVTFAISFQTVNMITIEFITILIKYSRISLMCYSPKITLEVLIHFQEGEEWREVTTVSVNHVSIIKRISYFSF
jgi:hypothetical protein